MSHPETLITAGKPVTGDQLIGRQKEIETINRYLDRLLYHTRHPLPGSGDHHPGALQQEVELVGLPVTDASDGADEEHSVPAGG